MKTINLFTPIFLVLVLGSCSNTPSIEESVANIRMLNPPRTSVNGSVNPQKDSTQTPKDLTNPMDSVTYWKMVRDSCPELFRKVPLSPYDAYDKCKSGYMIGWGCEVGMDDYFHLYAKVLKKKSGKSMIPIRKDTKEAMELLYFIANQLSGGGTFYSHMLARSEGEIEYSLYKFEKGEMDFSSFDFKKNRDSVFRKWKKNIHKSIAKNGGNAMNQGSNLEVEKQMLDSLSRMESLIGTPFTLTYVDEFCHRFFSDLNF